MVSIPFWIPKKLSQKYQSWYELVSHYLSEMYQYFLETGYRSGWIKVNLLLKRVRVYNLVYRIAPFFLEREGRAGVWLSYSASHQPHVQDTNIARMFAFKQI